MFVERSLQTKQSLHSASHHHHHHHHHHYNSKKDNESTHEQGTHHISDHYRSVVQSIQVVVGRVCRRRLRHKTWSSVEYHRWRCCWWWRCWYCFVDADFEGDR